MDRAFNTVADSISGTQSSKYLGTHALSRVLKIAGCEESSALELIRFDARTPHFKRVINMPKHAMANEYGYNHAVRTYPTLSLDEHYKLELLGDNLYEDYCSLVFARCDEFVTGPLVNCVDDGTPRYVVNFKPQTKQMLYRALADGGAYVASLDILNMFGSITEATIQRAFERIGGCYSLALKEELLKKVAYLRQWPMHPVACQIVSRILLAPLDAILRNSGATYLRVQDDILIFCRSRSAAELATAKVVKFLSDIGLYLNPNKSEILEPIRSQFLPLGLKACHIPLENYFRNGKTLVPPVTQINPAAHADYDPENDDNIDAFIGKSYHDEWYDFYQLAEDHYSEGRSAASQSVEAFLLRFGYHRPSLETLKKRPNLLTNDVNIDVDDAYGAVLDFGDSSDFRTPQMAALCLMNFGDELPAEERDVLTRFVLQDKMLRPLGFQLGRIHEIDINSLQYGSIPETNLDLVASEAHYHLTANTSNSKRALERMRFEIREANIVIEALSGRSAA